ncbi:MAG: fatty acid--CoA ligase [Pseudomonadota bacterium]
MPHPIPVPSPSAYAYPLLIKQLLHTPAATAAGQQIVYRGRQRNSYADLIARIGRLANALAALDIAPGSTVAVMDWDSHRYLETFFAVPMMGAVLQTVNIRLAPEQIAYTLNHAGADIVLVHADFLPVLETIHAELASVRQFVLIRDDDTATPATPIAFAGEYEALLAAAGSDYAFPDFDENTRATTFYTTGTTGLPKGVYFSHRQLVLHTLAMAGALGTAAGQGRVHRGDVYMPITPMFHVHAWGMPYVATMLGLKQVYPGRYQPDALLRLIADEGVTFTHCVPTILHMLLASPAARDVDLSGLKMIVGGAALPKGLALSAMARGMDVFTGYGMSETCPILTLAQLRPDAPQGAGAQADLRIKAGYPVPLVELRAVDGAMRDVARDGRASGEIVVRTPWLTQGYLGNPEASDALWEGGYLHTGDLGAIDGNGLLQVTDRIKDVIKTGGEWVSSLALESIISQHPAVNEAAVIGVPDDKWGERPLALIVLRSGAEATAQQIRDHVQRYAEQGQVSRYAVPDQVRFVASLDRTSVGKIDKKALRAALAG